MSKKNGMAKEEYPDFNLDLEIDMTECKVFTIKIPDN